MNSNIMLIGLDGAPWYLVNEWIKEKKLSTLYKISQTGVKGKLVSTIPSNTFPAVPTLITGMTPGNHGVFSFVTRKGNPITIWDVKYEKIWNILDKNGLKSCIINIPLSYPPEHLNGVMISGWTPKEDSKFTYPENLQERIGKFHDVGLREELFELRNNKNDKEKRKELGDILIQTVKNRFSLFKRLNLEEDYNFSMLWIGQTDFIQHCCWEYKEDILRLYIEIDKSLSDILETFPNKDFFIVSDHGFESNPKKFFFVNSWLKKEGYLDQKTGTLNKIINEVLFYAYNRLPRRKVMQVLAKWHSLRTEKKDVDENGIMVERFDNIPGIDTHRSKAFLSTLFGIKINDVDEYESVRNEIISKLKKLKDDEEEKVIRNAWRKEEVFKGKYLPDIPDIVFLTSEKYAPFPAMTKDLYKEMNREGYWWQSGEHYRAREGMIVASGPSLSQVENDITANIEDVTPTILHLLGLSIPSYIDGKVLTEITQTGKDPTFSDDVDVDSQKKIKLNKEDQEKIIERLRKLGYIQ